MDQDAIAEAARRISAARRGGEALAELPPKCTPRTLEAGYMVQSVFRDGWGEPPAGWKIGATAGDVQALYGLSEPFFGPFFDTTTFASPGKPRAADFGHLCLETEFAFRFSETLAPRRQHFLRDEVCAAVDAFLPAFEIISPRFDTLLMKAVPTAIADCALNGGFVFGAPVTDWQDRDLKPHPVRLSVDGALRAEGTGARALGDPVGALIWQVNALSAMGITLEAGQIISTGTCTGINYVEPGETAVGDFGELGAVEVTFV